MFGYRVGDPDADLTRDDRDSAPFVPKSVVVDPAFTWGDDRPLRTPWHLTVIYEAHVKGFTIRNPAVPKPLRGTYAGLASPASIEYLRRLGVTAVELMPVHHFVHDRHLVERGLTNYWGYNTIGFFAPDSRYGSEGVRGEQVREFKTMVKTLHQAGIEVILDVVYNHTAEGNHLGPTLCFRGIDNAAYYRLVADDRRYYMDYTGCGNTLNMTHPRCVQLIMDSLRYWVSEMHVDGFRFDLASTLARELHEVDRLSSFFDMIHQDPLICQVKLIAEPWDLGEGGYQVGNFPAGWAEWNGRYRDTVRRYWKGDGGQVADLAYRLTGSSDLYESGGRRPSASVNFVTAHDGFTLLDLVSYNDKHNEANGEENRDGTTDNLSWNCGVEGPTDDPAIIALRERQLRNFLATLVPLAGRADAARRRRDRADPAGQQQRLLPGQRDLVGQLGAVPRRQGAARVHAAADPAPPRASGLPPAALLPGPPHRGLGGQGSLLVPARRQGDDGRGLDERLHALPGPPARRGRDRGSRSGGGAHPRRHVPAPAERAPRGPRLRAARPPDPRALGAGPRHARLDAGVAALRAGDQYPLEARSLALLRLRASQRTQ